MWADKVLYNQSYRSKHDIEFAITTILIVLWRYHVKNLQTSDDVVGHIKLNEAIRNITEIQFKSK